MDKLNLCGVKALLLLTCFVVLVSSCVNEKYDMSEDRLNLEATYFQEGLILPLGSMKPILLGDILPENDYIKPGSEDGAYAFRLSDAYDFNQQLSELQNMIDIPALDFSQAIPFSFEDVDVSSIEITGQTVGGEDIDLTSKFSGSIPEIDIPGFTPVETEMSAGMNGFVPKESDMNLALSPVTLHHEFLNLGTLPSALLAVTEPVELESLLANPLLGQTASPNTNVDVQGVPVELNLHLPAGIKDVKDVKFTNTSAIKVTLSLTDDVLVSGSIVPNIELDLSDVFVLRDNATGKVNLSDGLTLSESNGYSPSPKVVYVDGLVLDDMTLTATGTGKDLTKSIVVPAKGSVNLVDLKTTTAMLNEKILGIDMKVEFVDLKVDDVEIEIEPKSIPYDKTMAFEVDIDVPDGIKNVENVTFTTEGADKSGVALYLEAQNLAGGFVDTNANLYFTIKFPLCMNVPDAIRDEQKGYSYITLSKDLSEGPLDTFIDVTGLTLPDKKNNKIQISESISVECEAVVDGIVSTKQIAGLEGDLSVSVSIRPEFHLADYSVEIEGFGYDVEYAGEDIDIKLENFPDINSVVVYPEKNASGRNPEIVITLDVPTVNGLDITPSATEGIVFSFPSMLVIEENVTLPEGCEYRDNKLTLSEGYDFRENIVLPVEKLVIQPVVEGEDKYVRGKINVEGRIEVSGIMDKAGVDDFKNPAEPYVVSVKAVIPDLRPSTLKLDSFETAIEEKVIELDILKKGQIPDQLAYLDEVVLKDTYINLEIDGSGTDKVSALPDLGEGSELSVSVTVDLPEFIRFDNGKYGKVTRDGVLDLKTKKISIDPIKIDCLVLKRTREQLKDGLTGKITVGGNILLENASLDVDEWLNKDLNVNLVAVMKSERADDAAGEDGIDIASVSGRVDYEISPDPITIELGDLTANLGESIKTANLDFNHVHLALDIATNLTVPVEALVSIAPSKDGVEGEPIVKTLRLNTEVAPDSDVAYTRYWLANNEKGMPGDYTYENIPILDYFKNLDQIPDKFVVDLKAKTLEQEDCELDMSEPYTLTAEYEFALPMEFGSEFEIKVSQTMSGLPEILGTVLATGSEVALMGKIENSLPLALDLQFHFLDSDGNRVPAPDNCGKMHIKPCASDGKAVTTDMKVTMGVREGVKAEDIVSLELEFTASTDDTVVGVPVTEESSLAVPELQVSLPKGITVDMSEMLMLNNQ